MWVNKNQNIAPYDVDETLVMHMPIEQIPPEDLVEVFDIVTGNFLKLRANRPMIRLLKESRSRGEFVRVHSRGGWQWAVAVVEALKLEDYVDQVESKATKYFDDTPVEKWMVDRIYIGPNEQYKNSKESK